MITLRALLCGLGGLAGPLGFGTTVLGTTIVSGPVVSDTTWKAQESPYVVVGNIIVGNGATLTIEPGVEVRFDASMELIIGSSSLGPATIVARGTPRNRIVFTSSAGTPESPDWKRLAFATLTVDAVFDEDGEYRSGSIIEHCLVEHAAGGGQGAITIDGSAPFINHCEVRDGFRGIHASNLEGSPGLRILNSHVRNHFVFASEGAGIAIFGGNDHVIDGNLIQSNVAIVSRGGGVFIQGADSVKFRGNHVKENGTLEGGGVAVIGGLDLRFEGNVLELNGASGGGTGSGGGLVLDGAVGAIVQGNVFSENSASYAAGVLARNCANLVFSGNLVIGNSVFSAVGPSAGGGIGFTGETAIMIISNVIAGNDADGFGGGIYLGAPGSQVIGNIVEDNVVWWQGGGIYVFGSGSTLAGNRIVGNSSSSSAGGIYIAGSGMTLADNLVVENFAGGDGGGLFIKAPGCSLAGDEATYNRIFGNEAMGGGDALFYDVLFEEDGTSTLAAQNVCWGTDQLDEVLDAIVDFFDDPGLGIVAAFPFIEECSAPVIGDVNGDGKVDGADLGLLLAAWGVCGPCWLCPADLNEDCQVDGADLGTLLSAWSGGVGP